MSNIIREYTINHPDIVITERLAKKIFRDNKIYVKCETDLYLKFVFYA